MKRTAVLVFTLMVLVWGAVNNQVLAQSPAASLSLSPPTGTFNKNCNFTVSVIVNTGGAQTDGTDAIIYYDSTRFKANKITSGTIYTDYPTSSNFVDEANNRIVLSGMSSVSSSYSGSGTMATINFTVLGNAPEGATQMNFDFDPNDKTKTIDSNIIQRGTMIDLLSSVNNGSFMIGSGSCQTGSNQGATGSTGSAALTPLTNGTLTAAQGSTSSALPTSGSSEITWLLAAAGGFLTILAILGLAIL